jgi:hypothetical protein
MNPTTGLPVNGASIAISQRSTAAAVTWWTAETGGSSSTAAVVTDTSGRGTAWVARGAYNLTISGSGITTYVEPWDAIPASDLGGDTLWLPDLSVTNAKIASGLDAAKLTSGSLPASVYGSNTIPGTALQDASVTVAKMAAGSGTRLLGAYPLLEYTLNASSTVTLTQPSNIAVTHNNKGGYAVMLHSFRATSATAAGPTFRIQVDAGVVASQAYSVTSVSEIGMGSIAYAYSSLSGSHNWLVDITQTGGSTILGDGNGLLLLFEQY